MKDESSISAESFSEQDVAKEQERMTDQEKAEADAAMYGQTTDPDETPELVSQSLDELEKELGKMPSEKKIGWEKAKEKCPDLTGEKHRLMFLRCEVFNVNLAALRLVKYWDKRIEVYGESRAFLPLTLDGALKDDEPALFNLASGYAALTGTTDNFGRPIVFFRPSCRPLDGEGYDRVGMIRAIWYIIHASLESVTAQKKGIIFLGDPRGIVLAQFDRKLTSSALGAIKGCIPARVKALHVCHPPTIARNVVIPVIRLVIGKRLRARFRIHTGKDEKVLEKLKTFGIIKDCIPECLGGTVTINQSLWVEKRKEIGL